MWWILGSDYGAVDVVSENDGKITDKQWLWGIGMSTGEWDYFHEAIPG